MIGTGHETRTPREDIHREGSLRLHRYRRESPAAHPMIPVVLVYSLINRPTIFDLTPERSLVRSLLAQDLDVFLVDWGDPGVLESTLDLEGHLARLARALRGAADAAARKAVSVLGYCLGGTLALAATRPELVRSVGLLATPVVFSRGGTLALWATASGLDPRKLALGLDGNVPGPLLRELLRWQDPVGQLRKWITLGERAGDPEFLEIFTAQEEWANGAVSFPGRLYVELIERLYGEDALSRGLLPGIRLDAIQAPVLNVLSKEDRIVPADATRSLADLVGKGLVETHEVPGGHIGMTVGRRARETTHAALAHFFKTHPAL